MHAKFCFELPANSYFSLPHALNKSTRQSAEQSSPQFEHMHHVHADWACICQILCMLCKICPQDLSDMAERSIRYVRLLDLQDKPEFFLASTCNSCVLKLIRA